MKILLLGMQCAVLMIGTLIIWLLTYSRDERNNTVAEEIARDWGETIYINGPMAGTDIDSSEWIQPVTFSCMAEVETKTLHRNIYEAEVFSAHVSMTGTFDKNLISDTCNDTVYLKIGIETQQIYNLPLAKIGDKTIEWSKSDDGLLAAVNISEMKTPVDFLMEFDIRGSSGLFINKIGKTATIAIDGEAPNPSFSGSSLPNERMVSDRAFSARWHSSGLQAQLSSANDNYVGTNFMIGVDRYQKVSRSLKYAFIIILLTYTSVLFSEIMLKRQIPLLNYFLIGVALILFYSLLLAFVEHLPFGASYLIASVMVVVLIGGYMWRMLSSRTVGLTIAAILSVLYLTCYIILSLSTYALLFGSLLLFAALAAMMYGSLHLSYLRDHR
ncbi:MAG: cell envelope integrity protein CreD [Muribaculaceae bacterium]|nr:cell envelope integrity protein CreD [Muribaculaceae bacterium]